VERGDGGKAAVDLLVAAGVIVRRGDQVLLQRRGDDGSWGIPGGELVPGETLEDGARRELEEETGLQAGTLELLDVYSGPEFLVSYPDGYRAFVVGATFRTEAISGELRPDDDGETLELAWFHIGALPLEINAYNTAVLARVGLQPSTSDGASSR
jgi:8-oxo-dGTP pyrophosphatase MutT (NUDIX family)